PLYIYVCPEHRPASRRGAPGDGRRRLLVSETPRHPAALLRAAGPMALDLQRHRFRNDSNRVARGVNQDFLIAHERIEVLGEMPVMQRFVRTFPFENVRDREDTARYVVQDLT